jgi:hypothetical protein
MRSIDMFWVDVITRSWIAFWIMCFAVGFYGWLQADPRGSLLERVLVALLCLAAATGWLLLLHQAWTAL